MLKRERGTMNAGSPRVHPELVEGLTFSLSAVIFKPEIIKRLEDAGEGPD